MNARLSSAAGFTLTELLVASAVSMILLIAAWGFYLTQLRSLGDQSATLDATERLRSALGFVAREIRGAGFDPQRTALTATGARGVSEARGDVLLVELDADSSGAIDGGAADPSAESILYTYDPENRRLVRTVAGRSDTLIGEVPAGGVVFEYVDADGQLLVPSGEPAQLSAADRDKVAFVRFTVRVEAVDTQQATIFSQTLDIALRNRILERL